MSHATLNTVIICTLFLVVLFFADFFREKVKKLYKSPVVTQHFLNVQAKIRSLEFAPSGIISIDIDGIIVSWNKGATNLFGYTENEVMGKPLTLIIPERYRERHNKGILNLKNGGDSKMLGRTVELYGLTKARMEFPIELSLWKWSEAGNIFYTGIISDITLDRQKDERVENILNIYKRAEDINEWGVWSWDVLNDKVYTTEGFNKIFDIDVTEEVESNFIMKRIYFEDVHRMEDTIKKAFEEKKGYYIEYRVVSRNGTLQKVGVRGEVYTNKDGELVNITGTIIKL